MQIKVPHFGRRSGKNSDKRAEFIEMGGECIHQIENLDDFYSAFGYTTDIAISGILPEEFIWEAYIRDNSLTFTECLQVHLIEYLFKHSDSFRNRYGAESRGWIAAHIRTISEKGVTCTTCRKNRLNPELGVNTARELTT